MLDKILILILATIAGSAISNGFIFVGLLAAALSIIFSFANEEAGDGNEHRNYAKQ